MLRRCSYRNKWIGEEKVTLDVEQTLHLTVGWDTFSAGLSITLRIVQRIVQNAEVQRKYEQHLKDLIE